MLSTSSVASLTLYSFINLFIYSCTKITRIRSGHNPLPILCVRVVSTSRNSITLTWACSLENTSSDEDDVIVPITPLSRTYYRLQIKDRTNQWTTAYWGYKTQVQIEPLSPGECYYFRLQVGRGQMVGDWSTLATSTKEDLPSLIILHRSIAQGLPHRARKFLSLRPQCVDVPDRAGRPALLVAAQRGDAEMVQLLLAGGADPNGGGGAFANGRTPLMAAAAAPCGDRPDVCRALCDRGARWDLKDRNGRTAFHYAAGAGHLGCIQMAIELSKLTVHETDEHGWTPLMHAAMLGADLTVLSMLSKAAPSTLRKSDRLGLTPLHITALTNQREAFAFLVELGGDPRQADSLGRSALQLVRFWAPPTGAVGALAVDATLSVAAAAAALLRTRKRLQREKQELLSQVQSRKGSRRTSSLMKIMTGKTSTD